MNAAHSTFWRAENLGKPTAWYHMLSERAQRAFDPLLRAANADQPITDIYATPELHDACREAVQAIRTILDSGRGFAIVTLPHADRYSPREWQIAYWLLGQLLGRPMEQNTTGTLLYDVRDTGQDVRYGARFSVTNAESTFHTDNSFGTEVLDYIALLCIHPAKSGGQSQLVNGHAVREELQTHHPGVCEVLGQKFHIDRRGGIRPGEEPTIRASIMEGDGPALVIRYLRYWVEVGHEKAGQPLTAEQIDAMNVLDQLARQESLRVEFTLCPGEMLFSNNRWLLHNRTSFQDHSEPERRRHLIRLWVRR